MVSHIFDTTVKGALLSEAGVTEFKNNQEKTDKDASSNRKRGTYLEDIQFGTVRTHLSDNPTLPTASYLQIKQNDPTKPLVSVDPVLTKGKSHLNADYLLNKLGQTTDARRLGDGFYEQQLVSNQVRELTGRRFLNGQHNDGTQYETLMNNGANAAQSLGLEVGKALTAEQMSKLTQDIVWFVEQERVVPLEGNVLSDDAARNKPTDNDKSRLSWLRKTSAQPTTQTIKVLVPQVYTVSRPTDVINKNAVISADSIVGSLNGEVNNSGAISAVNLNRLHADSFTNSGLINGTAVDLKTKGDFINLGGQIEASKQLLVQSGGKLEGISTEKDIKEGNTQRHLIDKQAVFKVTDADGLLALSSEKDMLFKGAKVSSGGDLFAHSKEDLLIDSVRVSENTYTGGGDNFHRIRKEQDVGSQFQAVNNLTLIGDKSIYAKAAHISSENGRVHLQSKGDVTIAAGEAIEEEEKASKSKKKRWGGLKRTTEVRRHYHRTTQAIGSEIDGEVITISAGRDFNVIGSDIVAEKALVASAKRNVNILSGVNTHIEEDYHHKKKSGLMGTGGLGFTIGNRTATTETDGMKESAARSTVGSLNGDTFISAGEHYQQTGSIVTAVKGNVLVKAKSHNIEAARSDYESNYKHQTKQKGLTIALNIPALQVIQAVRGAVKSVETVGESKSGRINAMATANAAWSSYRTANKIAQLAEALKNNPVTAISTNLSVSITYGQSRSISTQHTEGNRAESSQINAGGKAYLIATGGGVQSNINIVGSDVGGLGGTYLKADNQVNIVAADQNHLERSANKSSGWNAGVAIALGKGLSLGFTAGGHYGKGYGNGEDRTWVHSHIGDKNSLTQIESGGDTTLRGGQLLGKGVKVDAKNLNIESLQDIMRYEGKQKYIEGQVTIGYGFNAGGAYGQSKVNADYASVKEQSGIFAGDEGYQVNIKGHTDLKGGLITSSEAAEAQNKNVFSTGTLSYSDIQNHGDYTGSALGLSANVSMGGGKDAPKQVGGVNLMELGANNEQGEGSLGLHKTLGYGRDKDKQGSVTKSGINTANITITDRVKQQQLLDYTILPEIQTGNGAFVGVQAANVETLSGNMKGIRKDNPQSIESYLANVKTNVTLENAEANSGKLAQNFDRARVEKELSTQVSVTQEFDRNRQELKAELYAIVDGKRAEATEIRRNNYISGKNGYDTDKSIQLDKEADSLNEKIRWIDMGLGAVWGLGDEGMFWKMYATTQADRAYRSATAPKEMWFQKCQSSNGECNRRENSRQIWSLKDLTEEEQKALRENGNLLTISNPGIFNDRADSLKNAQKQNTSETNQRGIIVAMNPPTGDYKGWNGWKLVTSLPSELLYAAYDKLNDKFLSGVLPLSNSQKLNQDLYRQAMEEGYQIDLSNHSRGGLTASIALKDMNIWQEEKGIPIRQVRFYGTATNVKAYAEQLRRNGYSYKGEDGKTYQSGAYSAVQQADFVGNKWLLGLVGSNDTTGGACWFCYSHSSYYAEVPEKYKKDALGNIMKYKDGEPIKTNLYKEFVEIWGEPKYEGHNPSSPVLVVVYHYKT